MKSVRTLILFVVMMRSSVSSWRTSNFIFFRRSDLVIKKHVLNSHHRTIVSSSSNNYEKSQSNTLYELRKRIDEVPQQPGVYMFRDEGGKLLYVGKSVNLKQRVKSYFRNLPSLGDQDNDDLVSLEPASSLGRRQSAMVRLIRSLETMVTFDAGEALMLEASLVRVRQPPFNVLLKDDSTHYPYLCITWSKPYPQFYVTSHKFVSRKTLIQSKNRRLGISQFSGATSAGEELDDINPPINGEESNQLLAWPTSDVYLGPFVEGSSLKRLLSLVKECFPLRQRWFPLYPDKTCLNYEIGRCPGVCQGLISPSDYRNTIGEAQMVFEGRSQVILGKLEARLQHAIDTEAFELADTINNQIEKLKNGGLLGSALPFDCDNTKDGGPTCDVWAIALAPHTPRLEQVSKEEEKHSNIVSMNKNQNIKQAKINSVDAKSSSDICQESNRLACLQLFQIRKGRVEHRLGWSLNNLELLVEEWDVLSQVMTQYYGSSNSPCPPANIITSSHIPTTITSELEAAFSAQRADLTNQQPLTNKEEEISFENGRNEESFENVQIVCPTNLSSELDEKFQSLEHGTDYKNLVKLALHNAQAELVRIGGRNRLINTALDSIASLLKVQFSDLSDKHGRRIEGLDISHTGGSHRVASFVVFNDGKVSKRHHRTFLLDTVNTKHKEQSQRKLSLLSPQDKKDDDEEEEGMREEGMKEEFPGRASEKSVNDDCRSIREAVRMRFGYYEGKSHYAKLHNRDDAANGISSQNIIFPNLLLVDGGKGQLNAAVMGLNDCGLINDEGKIMNNMVVCSLAKKREEIFIINQSDPVAGELAVPNSPAMVLLRQVRDEAHRIAVSRHRKKRDHVNFNLIDNQSNTSLSSASSPKKVSKNMNHPIDRHGNVLIPGVRSDVVDELMAQFGSLQNIKHANSEQLLSVKGIGPATEQKIRLFFSKSV